ncbi:hypothetical protein [Lysinibacillus sp. 3P01SB]|uniref:hypothetical protein n=1 Tax=Lysinibacillus sp. 3P01SB TaxID=3132284 RepID=UPI0039A770A7
MEVLKIATQTLQLAIQTAVAGVKSVVDAIKVTTDATKIKVDTTANKVDSIDIKVGSLFDGRVVKSVQRGTANTQAEAAINVVIASVNLSRSFLELTGSNSGNTAIKGKLTNNTTISIYGGAYITAEWQVIEFY